MTEDSSERKTRKVIRAAEVLARESWLQYNRLKDVGSQNKMYYRSTINPVLTNCMLCQKGKPWVGGIAAFGGNPPGYDRFILESLTDVPAY